MTIAQGQTYHHAYDRRTRHVVCQVHAKTNRRALGSVADARIAGPCEVCCEDEAREVLGRMAHGTSVQRRTVPAAVRRQLVDRRLAVEMTDGLLDPTPRAEGYCATPDLFDWDPDPGE